MILLFLALIFGIAVLAFSVISIVRNKQTVEHLESHSRYRGDSVYNNIHYSPHKDSGSVRQFGYIC